MAGDDSAAAQPKPGKLDAENRTEQEKQGIEAGFEASEQQQSNGNDVRPALPPKPLPPSHQEVPKDGQGQTPGPVRFQPALPDPYCCCINACGCGPYEARHEDIDQVPYEIPFNPRWHKAKIVLMLLAVAVSAVIIGLSVATGYAAIGDRGRYYIHESAYIAGVSASAAILSLLFVVIEMLNLCLSRDRRGMHPGWLVIYNLVIGILAAAAFGIMIHYVNNVSGYDGWFRYFEDDHKAYEELTLFRILLGFDFALFFFHLILFIGACCETSQRNKARRAVQVIQIPFDPSQPLPEGFRYAAAPTTAQYPPTPQQVLAMRNAGCAPPPRPQRVSVHGVIPYITPEQAALYGGYYSPMPTPVQPQHPQQGRRSYGGYYAPAPHNPFAQPGPKRSSMRGGRASAVPAPGSEQANTQPAATLETKPDAPLPAVPTATAEPTPTQGSQKKTDIDISEKVLPEEPVSEKVVSEKVVSEKVVTEK
ncbi:hypothetical protein QBC36DRAFT_378776 [Triangularia setosa]|uniref:Uncharacterized protein n=1 Tax=Triangularia setosa TaxID=2587417 RepID=A0AAN6W6N8_9PEZI|nr:hypothetical protein QBC36DRAFT_378776 [Podospora setosa]